MKLYLLPGLGADGRLFSHLKLDGHQAETIDWPAMPAKSTLRDFATALAGRVDATKPHALIGVSMGGMVAQELALITKPKRTIIISSWKGPHEMPLPLKLLRGTHPERLLTPAFMKRTMPFARWQMGVEGEDDKALFDAFVAATPIAQMRIQIAAVLGWEGPARRVKGLAHIHGDADRLMPIDAIAEPTRVPGGGHFMVYNRAKEVDSAINSSLSST